MDKKFLPHNSFFPPIVTDNCDEINSVDISKNTPKQNWEAIIVVVLPLIIVCGSALIFNGGFDFIQYLKDLVS